MNIGKTQLNIISDPSIKKIESGDKTIKKQFQFFFTKNKPVFSHET